MKYLALIIPILLFSTVTPAQETATYSSEQMHFSFEYPSDWTVAPDIQNGVKMSGTEADSAFVLIIHYRLDEDNLIGSHDDLLEAISGLYDRLGIASDRAEDISYNDDHTISLENRYVGRPGDNGSAMQKYIKVIICRPVSGGQVMFLIRAEISAAHAVDSEAKLRAIVESFRITEELYQKVYPDSGGMGFLIIFAVLALTALFFARNRRIQRSKNPLGADSSHFWRCTSCRLVNHIDHTICQRCGAERPTSDSHRV